MSARMVVGRPLRRRAVVGAAAVAPLLLTRPAWGAAPAGPEYQLASPLAAPLDAPAAEAQIVGMINTLRAQRGLPTMQADERLAALARERSQDMMARGYFSHDIPGVGPAAQWALDALPDALETAENLGRSNEANGEVLARLFDAWVASPGHARNLLRPEFNQVGIGLVEIPGPGDSTTKLVTQLFANTPGR